MSDDKLLKYAKIDRGHLLAKGLWGLASKGTKRMDRTVAWEADSGLRLEFAGPELDEVDLKFLLAVMAIAGKGGKILGAEPKTEEGKLLRKLLNCSPPETQHRACVVYTTWAGIMREMGIDKRSRNYRQLRECQKRLSRTLVSVACKHAGRFEIEIESQMLSVQRVGDELAIALCPQLAAAALNKVGINAMTVVASLREMRKLQTAVGTRLWARLSGFVNQGEVRHLKVFTLLCHCWPDHDKASPETQRQHRARLQNAMADLRNAGWVSAKEGGDSWIVRRPRALAKNNFRLLCFCTGTKARLVV